MRLEITSLYFISWGKVYSISKREDKLYTTAENFAVSHFTPEEIADVMSTPYVNLYALDADVNTILQVSTAFVRTMPILFGVDKLWHLQIQKQIEIVQQEYHMLCSPVHGIDGKALIYNEEKNLTHTIHTQKINNQYFSGVYCLSDRKEEFLTKFKTQINNRVRENIKEAKKKLDHNVKLLDQLATQNE